MNKNLVMPASIVLAGIIIAIAIIATNSPAQPKEQNEALPAENIVDTAAPTVDDDTVLGDLNAPITWIEFGDYQCPYCGQLFPTGERVRDEYVSKGLVNMVYRDFPLSSIHPQATDAAEAAECAGDQGRYWDYHDALFSRQSQLGKLSYVDLAKELGLDETRFSSCVENRDHKAEVEADYQDGLKAGVSGTPAVFINGELIAGAYPYEYFKEILDSKLSELGL